MRFSTTITTPVTPERLSELMGHTDTSSNGILLQAVSGTVNYGSPNGAVFTLAPGDAVNLQTTSTKSIFVGGGGDINVGLF